MGIQIRINERIGQQLLRFINQYALLNKLNVGF